MRALLIFLFSIFFLVNCDDDITSGENSKNIEYTKVYWYRTIYENEVKQETYLAKIEYWNGVNVTKGEYLIPSGDVVGTDIYEFDESNRIIKKIFNHILFPDENFKVEYIYKDGILDSLIKYNHKNRVLDKSHFKYDTDKKIIEEIFLDNMGGFYIENTVLYHYNDINELIRKEHYDGANEIYLNEEMEYNEKTQLVKYIKTSKSGDVLQEEFSYNTNGLIISKICSLNTKVAEIITYEYIE